MPAPSPIESDDDRNVVLTGFMGTGKTSVGQELAARLGFEFVDTDHLIEDEYGPITEIFATRGEDEFRRIEREIAAALADRSRLVISTGGRMLLDPANAEVLARHGRIVCLTATVDTIVARVAPEGTAPGRPLLAGHDVRERIATLLAERAPAYAGFDQIATDGRSVDEVVDAVVAHLSGT